MNVQFLYQKSRITFLIAFEMFTRCSSKTTYLKEVNIKLLSYKLQDKLILCLLMRDLCSWCLLKFMKTKYVSINVWHCIISFELGKLPCCSKCNLSRILFYSIGFFKNKKIPWVSWGDSLLSLSVTVPENKLHLGHKWEDCIQNYKPVALTAQ